MLRATLCRVRCDILACNVPTQVVPVPPSSPRDARSLAPVGVFDSGVGGLTVLRALARVLPGEDFLYLGDTARLPYGTKSPESIRRYALQAAALLRDRGVKCLVVACNTASAVALDGLAAEFAPVPPREMCATTAVRRWSLVIVPRLMAKASSTVWPRRRPRLPVSTNTPLALRLLARHRRRCGPGSST